MHLGTIFVNNQPDTQFLFYVCLFLFPSMFQAAVCSSSGELIVSIWHLVYVTVYRWPSVVHTRRSSIHSDIYQMSNWYN